jgi:glycosyltransferase involved in cell wall biosynthesis
VISYISDLEEGSGMGNYATQLYKHLKEETDQIENISPNFTSKTPAPRLVNEFIKMPIAYYKTTGDKVFLPEMNYAGLAYIPTNKELIVTVHDVIPAVTDYAPTISRKIMKRQIKVMKKADKIIAISEHTKKDLVEKIGIPEEKITVIYQGVDTKFFKPQERDEEILGKYGIEGEYLLYVGAEKDRKNFEGTLELFKDMLEERPELTLVKVGSPGRQRYREKHKEKIKELGIENKVIFTGFVDKEHLPQIYSSAEALLQLSHYEGFGRAPLEAMACGTVPIVSDKSSLPEVVGDQGIYAEKNSTKDILEKIGTKDGCRLESAEGFDWSQTAEETLTVIFDEL